MTTGYMSTQIIHDIGRVRGICGSNFGLLYTVGGETLQVSISVYVGSYGAGTGGACGFLFTTAYSKS